MAPFFIPRLRAIASRIRELRNDSGGVATIMLAMSLLFLVGAASISIDLASVYLARRDLQGIADSAAMAAAQADTVGNRKTLANALIAATKVKDIQIEKLEHGTYTQSKDVPVAERFKSGGDQTAVRVTLVRTVPLYFAGALGLANSRVYAKATASSQNMAAFSLSSKLASLSGGIPNQLLSALIGTNLNLGVMDTQGLASANVDVLGYADALRAKLGKTDVAYGEVFNQAVTLHDAIDALAAVTTDSSTAALLRSIASQAPYREIVLSSIVDLGPYAQMQSTTGTSGISVDAYSLLRSMLEISMGDSYEVDLDLVVTGLTNVHARIVGGRGYVSSPWLTISGARDYTLQTSQARILLTAKVATGLPLLPTLNLPLYVELAKAEARLSDIQCLGDPDEDGVTLGVTPAIGTLAIAAVDTRDMDDLSAPVLLKTATLVDLAKIATVTAKSEIDLGGVTEQSVLFTLADIKAKTVKTVSTRDVTQAIASSLIQTMDLKVQALGLLLPASTATSATGKALAGVAPVLDSTLFALTDALGVKVGAADTRVDKVRCGIPQVLT